MNLKPCAALVAALSIVAGCSSSPKGPVPVPDPRSLSGEGREWWDIYSVEFQGDRKVRTKVGYLYRKYDSENPKGYYWVRNLTMDDLGFLLPDYKAYLIVRGANGKLESQDLGIADRDLGVKRILQIPLSSAIELEKPRAPASPAGAGLSSGSR